MPDASKQRSTGGPASLAAAEWWDIIGALSLVLRVRLALWLAPFQRVRKSFPPAAPAEPSNAGEHATVVRHAKAVRRAARLVPDASCLTKALSLGTLLARRGIGCEVKIGVRKGAAGRLEAHAWVVHDGVVVIGGLPDLDTFSVIPRAV